VSFGLERPAKLLPQLSYSSLIFHVFSLNFHLSR